MSPVCPECNVEVRGTHTIVTIKYETSEGEVKQMSSRVLHEHCAVMLAKKYKSHGWDPVAQKVA